MSDPIAIAIDGPVASGKTVVGRLVARRLGCRFLDTGAMYRAATRAALQMGIGLEQAGPLIQMARSLDMRLESHEGGDKLVVDGEDVTDHLRGPEIEQGVSLVSRVAGVRTALVERQRAIAEEGPIVVAGRDIGTVVLPGAAVKVYLTASVEVRARRRYRQMRGKGDAVEYAQVVSELVRRDKIDSERGVSPLRPAEDAVVIETEHLGVEDLAEKIVSLAGLGQ